MSVLNLNSYRITEQEFEKRDDHVLKLYYDVKQPYGVDSGYFKYEGLYFHIYQSRRIKIRGEDAAKIKTILKIKELNRQALGITKEKMDKIDPQFIERCVNDIFVWIMKNANTTLEIEKDTYQTFMDTFSYLLIAHTEDEERLYELCEDVFAFARTHLPANVIYDGLTGISLLGDQMISIVKSI